MLIQPSKNDAALMSDPPKKKKKKIRNFSLIQHTHQYFWRVQAT